MKQFTQADVLRRVADTSFRLVSSWTWIRSAEGTRPYFASGPTGLHVAMVFPDTDGTFLAILADGSRVTGSPTVDAAQAVAEVLAILEASDARR